ncbi:MAG: hypothetical protein MHM6MM_003949 [Cercozoa sp. M6MM]
MQRQKASHAEASESGGTVSDDEATSSGGESADLADSVDVLVDASVDVPVRVAGATAAAAEDGPVGPTEHSELCSGVPHTAMATTPSDVVRRPELLQSPLGPPAMRVHDSNSSGGASRRHDSRIYLQTGHQLFVPLVHGQVVTKSMTLTHVQQRESASHSQVYVHDVHARISDEQLAAKVAYQIRSGKKLLYMRTDPGVSNASLKALHAIRKAIFLLRKNKLGIYVRPDFRDIHRRDSAGFEFSIVPFPLSDRSKSRLKKVYVTVDERPEVEKLQQQQQDKQLRSSKLVTLLRVSRSSRPPSLAGALAARVRRSERVSLSVIGVDSAKLSVKAIALARQYLQNDDFDIHIVPCIRTLTELEKKVLPEGVLVVDVLAEQL